MKIIIDECVPSIVKRGLPGRNIVSVQDQGWSGIKNGKLLRLVADEFDVFVTSDKNLRFQQNLSEIDVAIVLLPSNQIPVVKSLLSEIDNTIGKIGPREFFEIK